MEFTPFAISKNEISHEDPLFSAPVRQIVAANHEYSLPRRSDSFRLWSGSRKIRQPRSIAILSLLDCPAEFSIHLGQSALPGSLS